MSRRLGLCVFVLAVLAVPAAHAAGPPAGALQDGVGVVGGSPSGGGPVRYVAIGGGDHTTLARIGTADGRVQNSSELTGAWGIPALTADGRHGGLSFDGSMLVLGGLKQGATSRFLVVDTRSLMPTRRVVLNGSFAYDVLSPDGTRLYLIQHMSADDLAHYVVRAYDLDTGRLLPGRIADKTQQGWVMQGYALSRTTGAGGRWVYTLYMNPGGYPFVHALDTARGVAHCIGLPWTSPDQGRLANIRLGLGHGGKMLTLDWRSGRRWLTVNAATWRITHAGAGAGNGFAWRWLVIGVGGAFVLLLVGVGLAIRSRGLRRGRAGFQASAEAS